MKHPVNMNVSLKHLFISPGHNYYGRHGKGAMDYPIEEVERISCVAGRGIKGDRFFDYKPDYKGQITLALVEKEADKLLWYGMSGKELEGDPKNYERNINKVVAEIFGVFPIDHFAEAKKK